MFSDYDPLLFVISDMEVLQEKQAVEIGADFRPRSTDIWQQENSLLTLPSKGLKDPRFDWKQMARQQQEFVKCQ